MLSSLGIFLEDISLSSNIISPLVGLYKRIMDLPVVDLPEPDSQTKPNV